MKPINKLICNLAAFIFVAMGVVGIFLPLIPTTPFLLLALILLVRSNRRMAVWLQNNRYLGVYIRSYIRREKLPLRDKIRMILLVWISIGLSIAYLTENFYIRVFLAIVGIGVSVHIAMLRTRNYTTRRQKELLHLAKQTSDDDRSGSDTENSGKV